MTVWEAGDRPQRDWREALSDLHYHYHRLIVMIITGADPQRASKP